MKLLPLMVLLTYFTGEAKAVTSLGHNLCPDELIVKVLSKEDEATKSNSYLAKQKLKLEVLETVRGAIEGELEVKVLKNGPQKFSVGEDYHLTMREGFLCHVKDAYGS